MWYTDNCPVLGLGLGLGATFLGEIVLEPFHVYVKTLLFIQVVIPLSNARKFLFKPP